MVSVATTRPLERRRRVPLLATGVVGCIALQASALLALPTMRFDEPEFHFGAPIDGLVLETLNGIEIPTARFAFAVNGQPSPQATIGNGPGLSVWVDEPGIEGPTSGTLSIELAEHISQVRFTLSLSARRAEAGAIELAGTGLDGVLHRSTIDSIAPNGGFAGALVTWEPPAPLEELEVRFATTATRFMIDDLRLVTAGQALPPPDDSPLIEDATNVHLQDLGSRQVLVWQHASGTENAEIWAAELETPSSLSKAVLLARMDREPEGSLEVATAAANESVAVVWTSGAAGRTELAILHPGFPSGASLLRSAHSKNLQLLPAGSEAWRLIWTEDSSLLSRVYTAAGEPLSTTSVLVELPTGHSFAAIRSAPLGRFGFTVAFSDSEHRQLSMRWFDRHARPRSEGHELALSGATRFVEFELGSSSISGRSVLAWTTGTGDGERRLTAQRFFPNGRPLGSELLVEGRRQPAQITLDVNGAGDFGIAWTEALAPAFSGQRSVMARMFAADGSSETIHPVEVARPFSDFGHPSQPQLALDSGDTATLVYTRAQQGSRRLFASSSQHLLQGDLPCSTTAERLCLANRFQITAVYETVTGAASARVIPWSEDSGMLWFFDRDNIELATKVLDGRLVNGHFWVFYAALSDVSFSLHVEDTVTGERVTYTNPEGTFASVGDVTALPSLELGHPERESTVFERPAERPAERATERDLIPWRQLEATGAAHSTTEVEPDPQLLTLVDGRFEVRVRFLDGGEQIAGIAQRITDDTGAFWFFDESNLELVIKVLDGSALNGHHWIYYGSLSNVAFELEILDRHTGESAVYQNEPGSFASRGDTTALPSSVPR